MQLDLNMDNENNEKARERVKEVTKKKQDAKFQPTWEQVWKGYERPTTGKHKKGIFELKNSDRDLERLREVKQAVEEGTVSLTVPNSKISKSYLLTELYPVLEKKLREIRMKEIVEKKPSNYLLVTTVAQLDKVVQDLKDESETGLDTETTGLDVYVDLTVGVSITLPKHDYHVYIPFGHTTGEQQLPKSLVLAKLSEYLLRDYDKKFLHNAKFDKHMFIREGVNVFGTLHCTQIAMKVLNENELSNRLKDLLTKYKDYLGFKEDSYTYEQLFGKDFPFAEVPLDVACAYACKDTHGTYLLGKWQESIFEEQPKLVNVFYNIETPLLPNVTDMERNGMVVNVEYAKEYAKELEQELEKMSNEIAEEMGDVNLNSPQQMQDWLYDIRGLPDVSKKRKTDKPTLKILAEDEPILETVLAYKDLFKLWSTYITAIPEKVKSDGRIHGKLNQDTTDTGRFSSKDPNLQNFPPRARKIIVAPEGKILVSIDYSQIEPRFLSHITQDKDFMEVYQSGKDLYSYLASKVFGLPIEQCGDGSKWRKMMKTGLLAVMYGTSTFTLSKQLKITIEEAEQFIKDFYKTYPSVKEWIRSVYDFAIEHNYVQDEFGRKRRFPQHSQRAKAYDKMVNRMCKILGTDELPSDYWDWKKYPQLPRKLKAQFKEVKRIVERERRQMVNFLIQGASASIIKIAINKASEYLRSKGKDWLMIATVHDENIYELPDTITNDEIAELAEVMRTAVELRVPLKVDIEITKVWGEGFKYNPTTDRFFLVDEKTGETIFETHDLHDALRQFEKVG